MNHPQENIGADPRVKFPDPDKLEGRYARHVQTREFIYIQDVAGETVNVRAALGPEEGMEKKALNATTF